MSSADSMSAARLAGCRAGDGQQEGLRTAALGLFELHSVTGRFGLRHSSDANNYMALLCYWCDRVTRSVEVYRNMQYYLLDLYIQSGGWGLCF